jgi:signal transduction histidine kinase
MLDALRDFYTNKQNYDSGYAYADSMLLTLQPRFDAGGYNDEYIKALFYKGDALVSLNRFDVALELFYRAKKVMTDRLKLKQLYYGYYDRLSYSYFMRGNYLEAAKNYKLALESTAIEKDPFTKFVYSQMYRNAIGLCYSNAGMADSAWIFYNNALDYINRESPHFEDKLDYAQAAKAVVYGNMGQLLASRGNDSGAEKYMKESIRVNSTSSYAGDDAEYTRENLAALYLKQGRDADAGLILDDIKNWLKTNKSSIHQAQYYKLEAKANEKNGRYEKAVENINAYLLIDDSTHEQLKKGNAANIQHQLDFMERTTQLAELKADRDKQKIYATIYIASICMAVVVIILVLSNYRRSRNSVQRLIELNNQVRQKNSQMQNVLDALEKSHRENTRMMKVLAHDLRNPVGAMLSFTEMQMADSFTNEERKKMLPMLQKSCKGALVLIEEMLYSNASANELVKEAIELDDFLQYCVDQLQNKATEKQQTINFEPQHISLPADREKLWRVFSNLINNAIKFSPVGEKITVKMGIEASFAVVAVADGGIGIPLGLRDKIFGVNEDIRRKGTGNEPSFGLGLYIAKQIVEAHGGKIWFDSPITGGTIFYVSLPMVVS